MAMPKEQMAMPQSQMAKDARRLSMQLAMPWLRCLMRSMEIRSLITKSSGTEINLTILAKHQIESYSDQLSQKPASKQAKPAVHAPLCREMRSSAFIPLHSIGCWC